METSLPGIVWAVSVVDFLPGLNQLSQGLMFHSGGLQSFLPLLHAHRSGCEVRRRGTGSEGDMGQGLPLLLSHHMCPENIHTAMTFPNCKPIFGYELCCYPRRRLKQQVQMANIYYLKDIALREFDDA